MIDICARDVRQFSIEELRPFARSNSEFYGPAGREHYRLLAYLSMKVTGTTIIDIGTHEGASALALSFNRANTVLTFDVVEKTSPIVDQKKNIHRFICDLTDPTTRERFRGHLLASPLILIDIDPHEGEREAGLLDWLYENDYKGLVLLDDIWHFKALREKVWYQIPRAKKIDLSSIGHWSGTGLVAFGARPYFDKEPTEKELGGWTLVTGYFDLGVEPDATPELQVRSPSWYLEEHSSSTLAVEHDLIVFTEPQFEEAVWRNRPAHLHARTQVRVKRFDEFPLSQYRNVIWQNRASGEHPTGHRCARDPRNTASYYLFCMARYAMLKDAIDATESPFYAWINICIERMGIRNVMLLDDALACRRSRFSTCRIGYANPSPEDLGSFFGKGGCADPASSCGGCTFCSGFFTGDRRTMGIVCDGMEAEFKICLERGYGHADEQLMALVHARQPELFAWYAGDYAEMITNYAMVRENAAAPIVNLVLPAVAAHDWATARCASDRIWNAYAHGQCELSDRDLQRLLWAMREVRKHT